MTTQYLRKVGLLLVDGEQALDLSAMHFKFQSSQDDEESPNNLTVRVYNLKQETIKQIQGEYSKVMLQAGYEGAGAYGVIFQGTIKQYRIGKEADAINSYLDILAADGDIAYNFGSVNMCMAAGTTADQRLRAAIGQGMQPHGVGAGEIQVTGGVLPRGKVLFGLARAHIRSEVQQQGASWSINNGKINITPLDGYLPGEAVVLNANTGLIGRVEQTEDGMRLRCLLNPKLSPGSLIKIDNASINQTTAAAGQEIAGAQLAFNRYSGIQQFASVSADGIYMVYVAEHVGDTRGQEYYTNVIALAVDPVTQKVKPYG